MTPHTFFTTYPIEKWSALQFRHWHNRKMREQHGPSDPPTIEIAKARTLFKNQLQHIIERIGPYQSAPREWRITAQGLLDSEKLAAKKRETLLKKRAKGPLINAPNNTAAITVITDAGSSANNFTSTFSTPHTDATAPSTAAAPANAATTSTAPTAVRQVASDTSTHSSDSEFGTTKLLHPAADFLLPSGTSFLTALRAAASAVNVTTASLRLLREVNQGIVFIQHWPRHNHFAQHPADRAALRPLLPRLEDAPARLERYLSCFTWSANPANPKPQRPIDEDHDDEDPMWQYVCAAYYTFKLHLPSLTLLAPYAGESFLDANVWSRLLDACFLTSSSVWLNRREIVAAAGDGVRCDGVMRGRAPTLALRRHGLQWVELGFVEGKPWGMGGARGSDGDHEKVVGLMRNSLLALRNVVGETGGGDGAVQESKEEQKEEVGEQEEAHKKQEDTAAAAAVVVVGVLCVGFEVRFYYARNSRGDFCFFGEEEYSLTVEALPQIMRACWRMKSTVEKSYEAVRAVMERRNGNGLADWIGDEPGGAE